MVQCRIMHKLSCSLSCNPTLDYPFIQKNKLLWHQFDHFYIIFLRKIFISHCFKNNNKKSYSQYKIACQISLLTRFSKRRIRETWQPRTSEALSIGLWPRISPMHQLSWTLKFRGSALLVLGQTHLQTSHWKIIKYTTL